MDEQWVLCPKCHHTTRLKIFKDTVLKNFPLFCPKCREETIISVQQFRLMIINRPDAQTQS